MALAAQQLVRWALGGDQDVLGVVQAIERGGRVASVLFDGDPEMKQFVVDDATWLQRVEFPVGSRVRIVDSGEQGVVTGWDDVVDFRAYRVNLASGAQQSVLEPGLRPAVVTDPRELAAMGDFGPALSLNSRHAAHRLLIAHRFDDMSSLSNSRVWIKDHQLSVVHRVATTYPHRFLLADEVGLGKTIEAGLILRELIARGVVQRVLVLAPPGLVSQWQYELRTKFNLAFAQYTNDTVTVLQSERPDDNVWSLRDRVVASTTWAAWTAARRQEIALAGWDLVIIDEAHHVRRRLRGERIEHQTNLYRLATALTDPDGADVPSLLLLTATPMQLDRSELYSLIELLDPTLFSSYEEFEEHAESLNSLIGTTRQLERWTQLTAKEQRDVRHAASEWLSEAPPALSVDDPAERRQVVERLFARHKLSQVMIRNRKAIVGGFQKRVAVIWDVRLSWHERAAYDRVSQYVREGYARADESEDRALGFVMTVFRRLLASSSYALRQSLSRRIQKLGGTLEQHPSGALPEELELDDAADAGEASAGSSAPLLDEAPLADDAVLGSVFGAADRAEHGDEVAELRELVELLDSIDEDSKVRVLREGLSELLEMSEDGRETKVLIFTQSRDTQTYLAEAIGPPWSISLFHGGLSAQEKDAAVGSFRDGQGPQLLISTEAGGEGRNLQFCHTLINYDLPWNPMKVEQRIGRIDRIGQEHTVKVINLRARGTIEERVLEVLGERIGIFERTVGGLDPILGDVEPQLQRIFQMAQEAAADVLAQWEADLEQRVRRARHVEEQMGDLILDRRSLQTQLVAALKKAPRRVDSEDVRAFVLRSLQDLEVGIEKDQRVEGVYRLELGPTFEHQYPALVSEGRRRAVTFDRNVALEHEETEFIAFGHELMDVLIERALGAKAAGRTAVRTIFTDERTPTRGWYFVFLLELGGVEPVQRLVPLFVTDRGDLDADTADWLLRTGSRLKRETYGVEDASAAALPFMQAQSLVEREVNQLLAGELGNASARNADRLELERERVARLHAHRKQACERRLEVSRATLERLRASIDPQQQRAIPLWQRNVENAALRINRLDEEYAKQLSDLQMREVVSARQELLGVAAVEVAADPTPLVELAAERLPADIAAHWRNFVTSGEHAPLDVLIERLGEHASNIEKLSKLPAGAHLDVERALRGRDILQALAADTALTADRRLLVRSAVLYYTSLGDVIPDGQPNGFRDDLRVARAVAVAVGRSDLASAVAATPAGS